MSARNWPVILIYLLGFLGLMAVGFSFFDQIDCEGQLAIASFEPTTTQEIWGETMIGQSFIAPHPGLNRVDIYFQTYNRQNNRNIIFRLFEVPQEGADPYQGEEIFRTTFNASTITDQTWHSIEVPAIPDSAHKSYFFVLDSPTSEPGNAITVGGIQKDIYQPGTAYLGNIPAPADVAFRTCYQMTPIEKLKVLGEKMTRHRPGLWGNPYFYAVIILIYLLLLVGFFWKLAKLNL